MKQAVLKWDTLWLGGILLAGALLRCWGLGAHCLWFDEALSWRFLTFPFGQMLERLGEPSESHPPLFYFFLRPWAAVWGHSETALRSLAVFAGMFTILGTYLFMYETVLLGTKTASSDESRRARRTALLAAALAAFSILQIHASRQARMYSIGTALVTAESWLLLRALSRRRYRRGSWLLFGFCAALLCWTQFLGLYVLAAQSAFAAWYLAAHWRWRLSQDKQDGGPRAEPSAKAEDISQVAWAAATAVLVAVACFPVVQLARSKGEGIAWSFRPSMGAIASETSVALLSTFTSPLTIPSLLAWCLVLALLGVHLYLLRRHGWSGKYLAFSSLFQVALLIGYSYATRRSIYYSRYLTFIHIYWLGALALFVARLRSVPRWILLAGLAATWLLVSYPTARPILTPQGQPGMREAIAYIQSHRRPDEVLLAQRPITLIKALYYLRGQDRPRLCATLPSRLLQEQSPWLNDDDLITTADVLSLEAPGVWVLSTSWYNETTAITFPLPAHWKLERTLTFKQDYPGEEPVRVYYFRVDS